MWEQIQEIIINAILLLVPVLVGYLATFIKKKTDELQNKINKDEVNKYIDILESTVVNVVTCVQETFVQTLKNKGEFNEEFAIEAYEKAKTDILNILGEAGVTTLQTAYGDIDVLLKVLIEAAVKKIKPAQG